MERRVKQSHGFVRSRKRCVTVLDLVVVLQRESGMRSRPVLREVGLSTGTQVAIAPIKANHLCCQGSANGGEDDRYG